LLQLGTVTGPAVYRTHWSGSKSARSVPAGRAGSSVRTCFRYAHGSSPRRLMDAVILSNTAVGRSAPSPPRCSQFLRPTASGRIACSAGPLSIVSLPSGGEVPRVDHWVVAYVT